LPASLSSQGHDLWALSFFQVSVCCFLLNCDKIAKSHKKITASFPSRIIVSQIPIVLVFSGDLKKSASNTVYSYFTGYIHLWGSLSDTCCSLMVRRRNLPLGQHEQRTCHAEEKLNTRRLSWKSENQNNKDCGKQLLILHHQGGYCW
jgi:hypothetical protein